MKKTANYGLNLWEKTDRIQMEDFNADNAKIEAALAQEANARTAGDTSLQNSLGAELQAIRNLLPIVHLQTITTSSTANKVDIDLSEIDWNTYLYVLLRIDGATTSSAASFYVRMNGYSGDYDYYYSSDGGSSNNENYALSFSLPYDGTKQTNLLLVSSHGSYPEVSHHRLGGIGFSCGFLNRAVKLTTLTLVGRIDSYTISAGTKIEIYGIKL